MASSMTSQTVNCLVVRLETVGIQKSGVVADKTLTRVVCKCNAGTRGARLDGRVTPNGDVATVTSALTSVAATDIFTNTGTNGFAAGDAITFSGLVGGAGLAANTTYYVIATNLTATTFMVSATPGGATFDHTTNVTAGVALKGTWSNFDFFVSDEAGALTLPAVGDTFNIVLN